MSLVNVLNIWKRQRPIIIVLLLIGGGLGYAASNVLAVRYSAEADVLLSATNYEPEFGQLGALSAFEFEQVMSTKATLVGKPSVRAAAAELLGLDSGEELPAVYEVSREQGTQILQIEAVGADADDVVDTVNAVAAVFVQEENNKALAAVEAQADAVEARVTSTETRLSEISTEINRLSNVLAATDAATSFALENLIGERNATSQKLATELLQRDQINADLGRAARAASVLNVPSEATGSTPLPTVPAAVLGALVFGFAGLGLAAIREELSDRVRSVDDVEDALDLSPLAALPVAGSKHRKRRARRYQKALTRTTNQLIARARTGSSGGTTVLLVVPPRRTASAGRLVTGLASTLNAAGRSTVVVSLDADLTALAVGPTLIAQPTDAAATEPASEPDTAAAAAAPTRPASESIVASYSKGKRAVAAKKLKPRSGEQPESESGSTAATDTADAKRRRPRSKKPVRLAFDVDSPDDDSPDSDGATGSSENADGELGGSVTVGLSTLLAERGPEVTGVAALRSTIDGLRGRAEWVVVEAPAALESPAILPFVESSDLVLVTVNSSTTTVGDLQEAVELVSAPATAELGVVLLAGS